MNDLNNSKYAELMDLLEQQEAELNHLKDRGLWLEKVLKEQVDRSGEMYTEVQALRTQKKESEELSEQLKRKLRVSQEETRDLNERIGTCRKANRELKDQAEKERRRSVSACSLLRQTIRDKESEIIRIKGVLIIALLYSILVTVFQAVKDGAILAELKETGTVSWLILQYGVRSLLAVGEKAALQSRMQTTGFLQGICYHLTKIFVVSFIGGLSALSTIWLIRRIVIFYRRKMTNLTLLMVTAVSLAVVAWFGAGIQKIIPISRIEMIVQVQIAMAIGVGIFP